MKPYLGVSLMELIVVIAIITLIIIATLLNFPQVRGHILMEREAGMIALSLRQAQSYALSVKEFSSDPSFKNKPCEVPARFPPYGIHLVKNGKQVTIFGDIDCDNIYNSGGNEKFGDTVELEGGIYIKSLKGYGGVDLDSSDIVYKRPDPTTYITDQDANEYESLIITLSNNDGSILKSITVKTSGQVSID